jgi:hypothetical protein
VLLPGEGAAFGPAEVILRVVQQVNIQRGQVQPFQAALQLVFQEVRVDAVVEPFGIFHQVGKRPSCLFTLLSQGVVKPLQVANF